jgi:predicted deacylase
MESARLIDRLLGDEPGPTLVLVGGIHGNEPAGVNASRDVLAALRASGAKVRGEIVAFAGNVRGLAGKTRYLARDLNRLWTAEKIAGARATKEPQAELAELVELAAELEQVIARARGPVYAIDLHTTSAAGVPFSVIGASEARREFARHFHIPGLVGLEEALEGVLTSYLSTQGCVTMAVEGGQHDSPDAAVSLAAVVTVALKASGVVDAAAVPALADAEAHLAQARGDLPQMIASRYAVEPALGFQMEPGFANIQRIRRGTLIAKDGSGEIRAPFDGLVLLPLYQAQGSDGFFYGRALRD